MITAALTGNIGMGKSDVLAMFAELGAFTLSSDAIVSDLLEDSAIIDKTSAILGRDIFDSVSGQLDRKKVAGIIFNDDEKRKQYEALIHPLVYEEIQRKLDESAALVEVAVVEVPLLFESNGGPRFDKTITVYTNVNTALDRLEAAGMDRQSVVERLLCQMPIADKVSQSSYTVDNNSDKQVTNSQVRRIFRVLQYHASEQGGV